MKILVAMDSFKGCLSSIEAGNAVQEGIWKEDPTADVDICPLADGGEGTVHALCCKGNGHLVDLTATGPLADPVRSQYGIANDGVAIIEAAAVAGLTLIPENKRNPLFTTTYGIGETIRYAIGKGCRDFVIGLGGSGTNDGGVGMLQALGWEFLDIHGEPIACGAIGLKDLAMIISDKVIPELAQCRFRIACDVRNPLWGEEGCSAVFAPQKGADADSVIKMDRWLRTYSQLVQEHFPTADPFVPGAGAAGGLGFAFSSFLNGKMESGAKIVSEFHRIEEKIRSCDLIITGEGCLDGQSAMGKGPMYIARLGKKYSKPVVVLAGTIGADAEECVKEGVSAYFSILPGPMSLTESMEPRKAYSHLKNTATQVFRLYNI